MSNRLLSSQQQRISWSENSSIEPSRYLTPEQCKDLFQRVTRLTKDHDTEVNILSRWRGTTRWVRNRISASTDRVSNTLSITRIIRGARGTAVTNQFDDRSLETVLRLAEQQVFRQRENPDLDFVSKPRPNNTPTVFATSTYNLLSAERASVARALVAPTVEQKMLSAGYIEANAEARAAYDTKGFAAHSVATNAQYTVTVRSPDGTASGWAGMDHIDWSRIDAPTLSARALDKCLRSRNPVSIEPGYYTVVLEPQAVHELVKAMLREELMTRMDNERYDNVPYNLRRAPRNGQGTAKFGLQLIDERISIGTDPMDVDAPYLPFTEDGTAYQKVNWIEDGVLRYLPYDFNYALEVLGAPQALPYTPAYRMSGGSTTIDEMIAGTRRGILVTRFVDAQLIEWRSVLATGATADGTWLIEEGKVSKPIKNLRFNMSPLHALNNVEALGIPQRVFSPDGAAVVPPLRLSEFNFSTTSDVF